MFSEQISDSNGYIYSMLGFAIFGLIVLLFAIIFYLFYKKLLSKYQHLALELKTLTIRKKEILETLHFQQISVINIGATIQSVITEEFEQQNSALFYANEDSERRESKKHNWRKVSELAERLAYFTLRNQKRDGINIAISTKLVFADNEMMLNAILAAKGQQLDLSQQGHSMLNIPKGTLDKIVRGVILHASKVADPKTTLSLRCDTGVPVCHDTPIP